MMNERQKQGQELIKIFIWLLKTWSLGLGQSSSALPEESLQEFKVN